MFDGVKWPWALRYWGPRNNQVSTFLGLLSAFHPILVTWFLVVFGDEVTKILLSSLFIFSLLSKAKRKFKVKNIMQPKWWKKHEFTKICNEPGI